MTVNCSKRFIPKRSVDSVFYKKFTLNKSPKHDPICFPWITSSGEQYVPHEDYDGLAADKLYILVLFGKDVNIEPDSHAYK